jgi:hypothetical protein
MFAAEALDQLWAAVRPGHLDIEAMLGPWNHAVGYFRHSRSLARIGLDDSTIQQEPVVLARALVDDNAEVGATTIDRGSANDTIIGARDTTVG